MAPPKDGDQPTVVYFHVTVMSLDSIDENSMTYTADIFFAQSWKDWRLRFPDNLTQEYRLLPVQWLKDIWRPDSFFKNAKAVTFQEMTVPNHYVWLYQDKTILYMVKLTLVLSCPMNFQTYPHDTQECKMKIESLSHTTDDLVFEWDPYVPLVLFKDIELPQLDLVKNQTGNCTQVYSTGYFTCLEVIFTLRRRLGYYLFHTYIPTCLIVIMSWISFWIRPEAVPARVTLGVTSLLTLSTQHANSQKSLPPVSYIKAIDIFMSSCTVFVFFSLMEYALVNIVVGDTEEAPPLFRRADKPIQKKGDKIPPGVASVTKIPSLPKLQEERFTKSISAECVGKPVSGSFDQYPPRCRSTDDFSMLPLSDRSKYQCFGEHGNCHSQGVIAQTEISSSSPGEHSPKGQFAHYSATEDSPHVTLHYFCDEDSKRKIPYRPSILAHPRGIMQLRKRQKAILIDRVSRVLFPVSFTILNIIYWSAFLAELW